MILLRSWVLDVTVGVVILHTHETTSRLDLAEECRVLWKWYDSVVSRPDPN